VASLTSSRYIDALKLVDNIADANPIEEEEPTEDVVPS
jgi:hypothetical protein